MQNLESSFKSANTNNSHKGSRRIQRAVESIGTPDRSKGSDDPSFVKMFDGQTMQNMTHQNTRHMPKVGGPKMAGMSRTIKGKL